MPLFTRHLRRLSSNLTGRRKSAQSDAANDDAIPKPSHDNAGHSSQDAATPGPSANPLPNRTLRFEDEYDCPPPAYSFVENATSTDPQDLGRDGRELIDDYFGDNLGTPPLTPDSPYPTHGEDFFGRRRAISIDEAISSTAPSTATREKYWLPDPSSFEPSILTRLPAEVWMSVVSHLDVASAASLAMTTRALAYDIGTPTFAALNDDRNSFSRSQLLKNWAKDLPDHVLCYPCGRFHGRNQPGKERLHSRDSSVRHPLTSCSRPSLTPTVRLTNDRDLQFPLAYLATASHQHGSQHGIPATNLNKSWTPNAAGYDGDWSHRATFTTDSSNHLLMRVVSTYYPSAFLSPVEQRLILLNRSDYSANYTSCAHEARGSVLFNATRCALGHVPATTRATAAGGVVSQCAECRRLWRCNLCPSEYSVEVKLVEDRDRRRRGSGAGLGSAVDPPGPRFRYALMVSRWTDLGPCSSPMEETWAACSLRATYSDENTTVYPHRELGVRRAFERAIGARECLIAPVLIRRPCHWRSQRGWDLETFIRGSDRAM